MKRQASHVPTEKNKNSGLINGSRITKKSSAIRMQDFKKISNAISCQTEYLKVSFWQLSITQRPAFRQLHSGSTSDFFTFRD
jgi:hypothetical protein